MLFNKIRLRLCYPCVQATNLSFSYFIIRHKFEVNTEIITQYIKHYVLKDEHRQLICKYIYSIFTFLVFISIIEYNTIVHKCWVIQPSNNNY